jgi:2-hydroxychromene-2-carboxylate isomerase
VDSLRNVMTEPDAAFYFDLGDPLAYLAAEQMLGALGAPAPWLPVLGRSLPDGRLVDSAELRSGVELRARTLGLQPVRWPGAFPVDSELAMRAATYAREIGRTVPFAQAAFRQAFAGGRDLSDVNFVLIAAAACEMHPRAVLAATEREAIGHQLRVATAAAIDAGVRAVPAVRVGTQVFHGEDAIAGAQIALAELTASAS